MSKISAAPDKADQALADAIEAGLLGDDVEDIDFGVTDEEVNELLGSIGTAKLGEEFDLLDECYPVESGTLYAICGSPIIGGRVMPHIYDEEMEAA